MRSSSLPVPEEEAVLEREREPGQVWVQEQAPEREPAWVLALVRAPVPVQVLVLVPAHR
jgi:hypothetical protein